MDITCSLNFQTGSFAKEISHNFLFMKLITTEPERGIGGSTKIIMKVVSNAHCTITNPFLLKTVDTEIATDVLLHGQSFKNLVTIRQTKLILIKFNYCTFTKNL